VISDLSWDTIEDGHVDIDDKLHQQGPY